MAMNAATRVHRWARDCFLIQQVMGQKLKKFKIYILSVGYYFFDLIKSERLYKKVNSII